MSNLDNFVTRSAPPPTPITSQEVRDRSSIFIANIFRANTPAQAHAARKYLKEVIHGAKPASHEVYAWRCMVLKHGKTGLEGPNDFEVSEGSDDDGEQWAGSRVLKIMRQEAILDVVVVVSRWYGGILLGSARFTHIETCTTEVCRAFKRKEAMDECLATLVELDDTIVDLRSQLNTGTSKGRGKTDYAAQEDFNLTKARRLVTARENTIKSLKRLLEKKEGAQKDAQTNASTS